MKWKIPFLTVCFGKVGSGKTSFIKYVCHQLESEFDYVLCISPTGFSDSYNFLPEECVKQNYSDDMVLDMMKYQKEKKKKQKLKNALLILDDILGSINIRSDKVLEKLITTFRHYNISIIITTQYPLKIPPYVRANLFYAVFFQQSNESNYDCLEEEYKTKNMPKEKFRKLLDWCDRGKVVICNTTENNKDLDKKYIKIAYPIINNWIMYEK